MSTCDIVVVF